MTQRNQTCRDFLRLAGTTAAGTLLSGWTPAPRSSLTKAAGKPNFIIIFRDDMGHGDVGCFGSTTNRTPNIDRMAAEGARFTSFYVTSGVCTPSPKPLALRLPLNRKYISYQSCQIDY